MEQLGPQEGWKTPSWTLTRDVRFPMGKSRARWGGQQPDGAYSGSLCACTARATGVSSPLYKVVTYKLTGKSWCVHQKPL